MPERVITSGKETMIVGTFGHRPYFGAKLFIKLLTTPSAISHEKTYVAFHRVSGVDVLPHGGEIAADEESRSYFAALGNYFFAESVTKKSLSHATGLRSKPVCQF